LQFINCLTEHEILKVGNREKTEQEGNVEMKRKLVGKKLANRFYFILFLNYHTLIIGEGLL
jgi:hypothetical protein